MWTEAWLPSTTSGRSVPARMPAISTTVPVTFDIWVTAIILVRGVIAASTFSGGRLPSGSGSTQFSTTP